MGRMGMFRVQGFSDGFIVESDMWGDTIEIFNGTVNNMIHFEYISYDS
jgi:hypothetical protein